MIHLVHQQFASPYPISFSKYRHIAWTMLIAWMVTLIVSSEGEVDSWVYWEFCLHQLTFASPQLVSQLVYLLIFQFPLSSEYIFLLAFRISLSILSSVKHNKLSETTQVLNLKLSLPWFSFNKECLVASLLVNTDIMHIYGPTNLMLANKSK